MVWRTVPICDTCWVEDEGGRRPVRLLTEEREYSVDACYRCHAPTRGIYTRALVTQEVTTPDDAA